MLGILSAALFSNFHKTAAAELGQLLETHGAVKRCGFRCIVRDKLDLALILTFCDAFCKMPFR